MDTKRIFKGFLLCAGIALFLELTVFHFRAIESHFFREITGFRMELGEGLEQLADNCYRVTDSQRTYIELLDINAHVDNLHLSVCRYDVMDGSVIEASILATDEANRYYMMLPLTSIVAGIEESSYLRLHLSGKSDRLLVSFENVNEGEQLWLEPVRLNVSIAYRFHSLRFLVLFLICCILVLFRPGSILYRCRLFGRPGDKRRRAVIEMAAAVHMAVVLGIGYMVLPMNTFCVESVRDGLEPAKAQYNDLADALLKGQLYVDREPPEWLKEMDNPYDATARKLIEEKQGEELIEWDYAYYNGRYYSYFGVVPAILFFVPYKLLTHSDLPTWGLVTALGMLYCIAAYGLVYQICAKYFRKVSLGMYLLMGSVYIWGSAIAYLVHFGIVYSCPILCGLLFGTMGLSLWIRASREETVQKLPLAVGSLLNALVIGCRPHMAIVLLFFFPIFWRHLRSGLFFSKRGLGSVLCVIFPYLCVGLSLMWYNQARFGSPFDFGAMYNLTSNDMTHRGFVLERWPMGIFAYLFQPFTVKLEFPYIFVSYMGSDFSNNYLGYTNLEYILCGYFAMNSFALANGALLSKDIRNKLKIYRILGVALVSLLCGMILLLLDIQLAGMTQRYMSDFGWLVALPAICVLLMLDHMGWLRRKRWLCRLVEAAALCCIFLNLYTLWVTERYASLVTLNPKLYYTLRFWQPFY